MVKSYILHLQGLEHLVVFTCGHMQWGPPICSLNEKAVVERWVDLQVEPRASQQACARCKE